MSDIITDLIEGVAGYPSLLHVLYVAIVLKSFCIVFIATEVALIETKC